MKILAILMSIAMISLIVPEQIAWDSMTEQQRYEAPASLKAWSVDMSEDEFILFSSVVEAESDRTTTSIEGRVLIAEVILNRVSSDSFPDTITDVCCQSGQFSVVSNGRVWSVGRTNMSDAAVIEAIRRVDEGLAPNVMYFNCVGYMSGFTPYDCVGGNYFSLGG